MVLTSATFPAGAIGQPESCNHSLSNDEIEARLDLIQSRLDRQARSGRIWWGTWLSFFVAVGSVQLTLALTTDDPENRRRSIVGATGAFLSAAGLSVQPFVPSFAARRLRGHSIATRADLLEALELGESLLARSARRAEMGRDWLQYALVGGWAITTSTLLAVKYDDRLGAAVNATTGPVVSLVRILSTPRSAILDYESYRATSLPCFVPHVREMAHHGVSFSFTPTGLELAF